METNHKQRIVEKIKKSTNILVTVSRDPSVDELSAALALSLMLNKMDKHATAVYSGATPPAISFLEPQKTFEHNTDSLRDFIIALDKEKADRLRYKVEDDVVRIYITPYQTTITERDLDFSQGDFNVELIIALGVKKQNDLDEAISAHGRILHDATVVTINTDNHKGGLGSIEWNDEKASSLCEMLMSLTEALQPNLLDEQSATSLLTGIVAATNRFSNDHTSPRVMTMSAQLMAAGANQQLIADELEHSQEVQPAPTVPDGALKENTSHKLPRETPSEGASQAAEKSAEPKDEAQQVQESEDETSEKPKDDGELEITHDAQPRADAPHEPTAEEAIDQALHSDEPNPVSLPSLSVADLQKDLAAENASLEQAAQMQPGQPANHDSVTQDSTQPQNDQPQSSAEAEAPKSTPSATSDWKDSPMYEPSMGGTLNATVDEAAAAKRREIESGRNRTILSHNGMPQDDAPGRSSVNEEPSPHQQAEPSHAVNDPTMMTRGRDLQPVTMKPISADPASLERALAGESSAPTTDAQPPTIAELEEQAHRSAEPTDTKAASIDEARSSVNALFDTGGFEATPLPGQEPVAPPTQPPSFTFDPQVAAPEQPPMPSSSAAVPPPPMPPMPPMPDMNQLPPQPPVEPFGGPHPGMQSQPLSPQQPQSPPAPNQFQIPGQ